MTRAITSLAVVLCLGACGRQEDQARRYTEIGGVALEPAAPAASTGPGSGLDLAAPAIALGWKTPAGWTETAGSGFRLATFSAGEAECAIIAFPAAMGGSEAKISMWLSQLGAPTPAPERLVSFLSNPENINTDGGLACSVYDLSSLLGDSPAQSMLAGLVTVEGRQIAVRIKGRPEALRTQRDAFISLCKSLVKK